MCVMLSIAVFKHFNLTQSYIISMCIHVIYIISAYITFDMHFSFEMKF